ncbi:MAG: InlB B-repeat-containing protein, partial [Lachnospiraceae bacterium]|nr:InlB B-repeat-containing protein [Lachnospiraceae bacterium]
GYNAPVDTNGYLENDEVVIQFSEEFRNSKPGYHFGGWSTNKNATYEDVFAAWSYDNRMYEDEDGYVYTCGNPLTEIVDKLDPEHTTYYAIWTPNIYHVVYFYNNDNDLDLWTVDYMAYPNLQVIVLDEDEITEDTILKRYISDEPYVLNDGNRPIEKEVEGQTVEATETISRTGYRFTGWSLADDSSVPEYMPGDVLNDAFSTEFGVIFLYATWEAEDYTIKYDKNAPVTGSATEVEVSGEMPNQSITYDNSDNLISNAFTTDAYVFEGWALEEDATEATYTDGQLVDFGELVNDAIEAKKVNEDKEITLYAVWSYDTVEQARIEAKNTLEGFDYLDNDLDGEKKQFPDSFKVAEQLEIKDIINEYFDKFDAAESEDEVEDLLEEAIDKINDVKTILDLKLEANEAGLAMAQDVALERIEDLVDALSIEDYDDETLEDEVAEIVSKAAVDINDVELSDPNYVEKALTDATATVDELFTEAKQDIKAAVSAAKDRADLESVKKYVLIRLVDYSEYVIEEYPATEENVTGVITNAERAINGVTIGTDEGQFETLNAATTEVYRLYDQYMEDLKSIANEAAEARLAKAKNNAIADLNAYGVEKNSTDYSITDRETIDATIAAGVASIAAVTILERVDATYVDAKRAIDADVAVAEDNLNAVNAAKGNYKNRIINYVEDQNIDDLFVDESDYAGAIVGIKETAVASISAIYIKNYEDSETSEAKVLAIKDIASIYNNAKNAIDAEVDKANLAEIKDELLSDVTSEGNYIIDKYSVYDYISFNDKNIAEVTEEYINTLLDNMESSLANIVVDNETSYKEATKDAYNIYYYITAYMKSIDELMAIEVEIYEATIEIQEYAESVKSDEYAKADNASIDAATKAGIESLREELDADNVKINLVDAKRAIDAIVAEADNRVSGLNAKKGTAISTLKSVAANIINNNEIESERVIAAVNDAVNEAIEDIIEISLADYDTETGEEAFTAAREYIDKIVTDTINSVVEIADKYVEDVLAFLKAITIAIIKLNAEAAQSDDYAKADNDAIVAASDSAISYIKDATDKDIVLSVAESVDNNINDAVIVADANVAKLDQAKKDANERIADYADIQLPISDECTAAIEKAVNDAEAAINEITLSTYKNDTAAQDIEAAKADIETIVSNTKTKIKGFVDTALAKDLAAAKEAAVETVKQYAEDNQSTDYAKADIADIKAA